jgi:RNA polymerase sigma-70 factor (ECF subfamily)
LTDLPDHILMQQVRDGDLRRLAVLFERHHRALFQFFARCNGGDRAQSEDLVQEVYFRILRYRHSYDAKQPFTAWMYQIARNARIDHVQRRRPEIAQDHDEIPSGGMRIDDKLSRAQELELLRKALDMLPEDKREVLVMSRYQELKYEEIARILGIEVGAVKVRVFRAVRALGEQYAKLAEAKA